MWTELIWITTGTNDGLCEYGNESWSSIKGSEFID
jgi:hypothetical protein